MIKYLLGIMAIVLVACAPAANQAPEPAPAAAPAAEPTPTETPAAEPTPTETPAAEPTPAKTPATEETTPEEAPTTDQFGQTNPDEVITASDVVCNGKERALQFRFRNVGNERWELNQNVPFPPTKDLASVRLLFNNFEMNGRSVIIDGERMFGPNDRLSDNCGGVEVLAPGEEVTCFVQPVPVKSKKVFGDAANELYINSPSADGRVRFACE